MTAPEKSAIEEGLVYIGVPEAALPTLTLNVISGTVTAATPVLTATRNQAAATSTLVDDKSADVIQKGSGVAPFFSINLSPVENLNIAIKYEMATKLELINETKEDLLVGYTAAGLPITKFPDGVRTRNDMPAMLSVGAQYSGDKVSLAAGMNYYFDKDADYGHTYDADLMSSTDIPVAYDNSEIIASNGFAVQAGFEYDITDNLLVSAGYAWANKGVNSKYQSDLTFANATSTVGLGGAYTINERFKINLGAAYTMYQKDEKIMGRFIGTVPVTSWETYVKDTFMVGIGVDLKF
jgi:long-subunit fatty acid transport protein